MSGLISSHFARRLTSMQTSSSHPNSSLSATCDTMPCLLCLFWMEETYPLDLWPLDDLWVVTCGSRQGIFTDMWVESCYLQCKSSTNVENWLLNWSMNCIIHANTWPVALAIWESNCCCEQHHSTGNANPLRVSIIRDIWRECPNILQCFGVCEPKANFVV